MKLNFQSASNPLAKLTTTIQKYIEACKSLPDGELIDMRGLSERIKIAKSTLKNYGSDFDIYAKEYTALFRGKRWFGNAATIKELKKQ